MTARQQPGPGDEEALRAAEPVGGSEGHEAGQAGAPQQCAFWPEPRPAGVGVDARPTPLPGLLPGQSVPPTSSPLEKPHTFQVYLFSVFEFCGARLSQTYGLSLLSIRTFPGAGPGVYAVDSHGSFSRNVLTLQHGGRGSGRAAWSPHRRTTSSLLPPPSSLLPQCSGALPAPHPPFPGPLVGPRGISGWTRVHRSTPRRQSHGGLGSPCTQLGSWTPGSWGMGPQRLSWNKGAPPGGSIVWPQEQAPDSSPAPMPEMPDVTAPSSPESVACDCSPLGQCVPWGHCRSPCARARLG